MKTLIELEQYFKGEDSWKEYIEVFDNNLMNSDIQKRLLLKVGNRIELAIVIDYHFGQNSLNWLDKNVTVLDNLTPLDCLQSDKLITRLKVCLMRMF